MKGIATILVLVLGYYQIKTRLTTDPNPNFFPVLAAFGG
jgi:hypothetical protein